MDLTYLTLKFLIGGGIVVGITVLAQQVDPKYGGILAAAPILTTLACVFTYSEAGDVITQQLVISAFWFAIPSIIYLLTLWFLLARYPLIPSIGGAFGVWLVLVAVITRMLAAL
jgi:uncharacterized membrane protein (GlpM family)